MRRFITPMYLFLVLFVLSTISCNKEEENQPVSVSVYSDFDLGGPYGLSTIRAERWTFASPSGSNYSFTWDVQSGGSYNTIGQVVSFKSGSYCEVCDIKYNSVGLSTSFTWRIKQNEHIVYINSIDWNNLGLIRSAKFRYNGEVGNVKVSYPSWAQ